MSVNVRHPGQGSWGAVHAQHPAPVMCTVSRALCSSQPVPLPGVCPSPSPLPSALCPTLPLPWLGFPEFSPTDTLWGDPPVRLARFLKSQCFSSTPPAPSVLVTLLEKSGQPFTRVQPLELGCSDMYLDLI